jgi:hypothetical protein
MALSNIFNEPRREITESVVGTLVVLALLFVDYRFGRWWQQILENTHRHPPGFWHGFFVIGMVFGALAIAAAYPLLAVFPHFIGEVVCGFLANLGLELRPKERRRG